MQESKFEKLFFKYYLKFKQKLKSITGRIGEKFMNLLFDLGEENFNFNSEKEQARYFKFRKIKLLVLVILAPLAIAALVYLDTKDKLLSFKVIPIFYMLLVFALIRYKALSKLIFIPFIRIFVLAGYILYYGFASYVFGRFLIANPIKILAGTILGLKSSLFWGFISFFFFERFLLDSVLSEFTKSSFKNK